MAILDGDLLETARSIVARYPVGRERSAILPLLYLVQSVEGHVSLDGMREVGEILGLTTAEVEAVASFYTMLRLRPTGAHVLSVCTNLPCALRGARELFDAAYGAAGMSQGETSDDGRVTIHEEECLGACDAAPVVQVDFVNHDRVTVDGVRDLVASLRAGEVPSPTRGDAPRDFREASRVLAGLGRGGSAAEADGS